MYLPVGLEDNFVCLCVLMLVIDQCNQCFTEMLDSVSVLQGCQISSNMGTPNKTADGGTKLG